MGKSQEEILQEKQMVVEAKEIEKTVTKKLSDHLIQRIVQRFQTLDTDIIDGDIEPAFAGVEINFDLERAAIRVRLDQRIFTIPIRVDIR